MSSRLVVRPRVDDDIPALARVLAEVHAVDGYPVEGVADGRGWLMSVSMLAAWVATLDRSPVGHVMLTSPTVEDAAARILIDRDGVSPAEVAVVGRLFVSPRARGLRAGRELMETATARADDLGRRAVLDVLDKDGAAMRLYERLGWQRLGPVEHRHSGGQVEAGVAFVAG